MEFRSNKHARWVLRQKTINVRIRFALSPVLGMGSMFWSLGRGATVAQQTLDLYILVRIRAPQPVMYAIT
jgi:hypothetical protein